MDKIDNFSGEYRFLSNFWKVPVQYDGQWYPSTEHAYQAAKTSDLSLRAAIRRAPHPADAKKLGRRVTLRGDWEDIKIQVMDDLLKQKFSYGSDLARQLVATGTAELIEGNHWNDTFWGVCRGVGKNNLGKILMRIRANLKDMNCQ